MTPNENAAADVLAAYSEEVNSSDTNTVTSRYAAEGAFMPPYCPSAAGLPEVGKTYDAVFKAVHRFPRNPPCSGKCRCRMEPRMLDHNHMVVPRSRDAQ